MKNNLQLNIYLKRNNRACMVFKRNGILYRINNLTKVNEFIQAMKALIASVKTETMEDFYLELYDHRGKCWVLESTLLKGIVALKLWFQSESSGEHLDVRFSWEGIALDFIRSVQDMEVMAGISRVFGIYRK